MEIESHESDVPIYHSRNCLKKLAGKYLQNFILPVLVLQTSSTVLFLRYARSNDSAKAFIPTTVVFMTEMVKYFLCLLLLCFTRDKSQGSYIQSLKAEILQKPQETMMLAIPACLYTLQNNLLIIALTNLDAATYQATYQLKILTTAGFSVILLDKQLHSRQWVALVLLMLGVALVQFQAGHSPEEPNQNRMLGFGAVLAACFSSGYAGVFYEKLVKHSGQPSVVIRNLQLGIFSLLFSLAAMLTYSKSDILTNGMFYGYTPVVGAIILLQSVGGLIVAATIKYADNILKGFATSISIIVSSLCSWFILEDLAPGPYFMTGTSIVMTATMLYGLPVSWLCGCCDPEISDSNLTS